MANHILSDSVDVIFKRSLPERLRQQLHELAGKYRKKGMHLFIFGSFARADQRTTSDLDLGIEWERKRSEKLFTQPYNEIQELPTIRKIDLVDFEKAEKKFKDTALKDKIYL